MSSFNFDRVSHKYDETRGLPPGVPEHIARWVLSRLPLDPAIVEIGVGTGRIALPFIQASVRFTGFDISEKMTAQLFEKLGGDMQQAEIRLHDISESIPLPDKSQDAVIAVHILHLVDAVKVLPHVRRVLKPGGVLIWGYEHSDDGNPHKRLRDRFNAEAASLGYRKRDFRATPGRALLAEWGASVSQHVVATWSKEQSLREHLDRLRGRVQSSTWSMTDEQNQIAADRVETWATEEFGDLDRPLTDERRFVIDWYVLGGT